MADALSSSPLPSSNGKASEPERAVLILGACLPVWSLTIDAFIKFQLQRKPLGQCGTNTLRKTILKLLEENHIEKTPDTLDYVVAWSMRYATQEIGHQVNFPEEARAIVIADLMQAFVGVHEAYLTPHSDGNDSAAPAHVATVTSNDSK